ncbi:hypothetical protein A3A40_02165 [Candidatus Kaiserbacteria bacterium RIFCSPLOWO2_01_FULL_54_20]|uniref:LTD domain-containing protein n=1 Tax=Candidatus Kaiserbacteria bacterium RIFCSPLOWO2_01_FULL_54_20 TaxID=1798513 RepID=A0A1F6EKN3_9BACT|nr:MAG: hypothetical protein A3A40_02165 [Candidatus Kaiserbacteria bacterium RIFCSPLOWO2_01_FULL_54_20]
MSVRSSVSVGAFTLALLLVPLFTHAFPFGGRASTVLRCVYNSTIYANLGPPRGGEYIWTSATKTYQFGPPAYVGQWLLGLAGAPYYCIYRISPLTIYTGIAITMMGSSGPAAPVPPPTIGPSPSPTPPTPPTPPPPPTPNPPPIPPPGTLDHLVISEVYYAVDTAHGTKPANEWIEIFNGTAATVNIGGWRVEDATASDLIPSGTMIAPGRFVVISATSTTRSLWSIPSDTPFVSLGSSIGDGLSNSGDRIVLRNASGAVVDAVSWGTNTTAMNPSATVASYGNSLSRVTLSKDTNTASDWGARPPSIGK